MVILVAVLVLSFYISNPSTTNTTVVRDFPQAKRGKADTLFTLEAVNPTPHRLNYSFTSNTTISLFVQTKSQFENSASGEAPDEYLATFSLDEGSITYTPEDQTKRHIISVYAEENFIVREIILEAEYDSVVEGKPSTMSYLLQLLVVVAIGVQGYTMYLGNKED